MSERGHGETDEYRYMTHEQRIAEGLMRAPELKRAAQGPAICFCGKTVLTAGVTCPRECLALLS